MGAWENSEDGENVRFTVLMRLIFSAAAGEAEPFGQSSSFSNLSSKLHREGLHPSDPAGALRRLSIFFFELVVQVVPLVRVRPIQLRVVIPRVALDLAQPETPVRRT